MTTVFIEVINEAFDGFNWGKFMIARFEPEEWRRTSIIDKRYMLQGRGWSPENLLVVDLQTGEGAIFRPGGLATADLIKHNIWVCPMFEPFLTWLYKQNLTDLLALPNKIDLDAEGALYGYRRQGNVDILINAMKSIMTSSPIGSPQWKTAKEALKEVLKEEE